MPAFEDQKPLLYGTSHFPRQHLVNPANRNGTRSAKPRKADEAYRQLKDLILTSELAPGEMLDERYLMAWLNIGRTPLREAIQRLAHEGLVSIAPRKGSWVTGLSISDLQELIGARELVEPAVAAVAAERVTGADIELLSHLIDDVGNAYRAGDLLASIQADRAFHRTMALVAGNAYLARIVDEVNTATLRYWHLSFKHAGDLNQTYQHHHAILEQLERQDAEGVRQALHDHIGIFRTRMQQVLGSGT